MPIMTLVTWVVLTTTLEFKSNHIDWGVVVHTTGLVVNGLTQDYRHVGFLQVVVATMVKQCVVV